MKLSLALPVLVLALAPCAFAQQRGGRNGGNTNNGRGTQGGALPLPKGVNRVISIDAYNVLLAESQDENDNRIYTPIIVKHVYSGGMAALFGGVSIPTAQFVSPGTLNGGNGNGNSNRGGNRGGIGGGFNSGGGINGGGGLNGGIGGLNGGIGGINGGLGGFNGGNGGFNGGLGGIGNGIGF